MGITMKGMHLRTAKDTLCCVVNWGYSCDAFIPYVPSYKHSHTYIISCHHHTSLGCSK